MDILDTSAIIAISRERIDKIAEQRDVAVSPYSIWELLSHIDEAVEGEDEITAFKRKTGIFKKFTHINTLDDPLVQHVRAVDAEEVVKPTRFGEGDLARQLIIMINESESIPDLYGRAIDVAGKSFRINDLAKNARTELTSLEDTYRNDAKNMWNRIKERDGINALTDDGFWEWLKAMLTALKDSYEKDGIATAALLGKVARSMYPYYGYLFKRLQGYVRGAGDGFEPPRNDLEDGLICMHLDLFSDDILVTNDHGTISALSEALAIWNNKQIKEAQAQCRIATVDEYLRLIEVSDNNPSDA